MEITRRHRETLLSELTKVNNALNLDNRHLNDLKKDNESTDHVEIHIFLNQQKKELIEQSLIDNEIDF